jgi:hypothetical protein
MDLSKEKLVFDNTPDEGIEIEFTFSELSEMLFKDEIELGIRITNFLLSESGPYLYMELSYSNHLKELDDKKDCLISSVDAADKCFYIIAYFTEHKNVKLFGDKIMSSGFKKINEANSRLISGNKTPKKTKKLIGYEHDDSKAPF